MTAFHDIQPTFAGGELTPAMYSRVDMAKYKTALKTARNGIIHPQGGFSARPGFKYVAEAKYSAKECRLIAFQYSNTEAYMLEVGDQYIRFYKDGAQILLGGIPYEVTTPYLEADLPLLKWTQSADTLYLAHPDYAPMTLVRNSDADWTLSAFEFKNGPYMLENATLTSLILANSQSLSSSVNMFTADSVGTWFKLTTDVSSQTTTLTASADTVSTVIRAKGEVAVLTTGTWNGTVQIQYGPWSSAYSYLWQTIAELSSTNDTNYNTTVNIPFDYPVYIRAVVSFNGGSGGPIKITLNADGYSYDFHAKITSYASPTSVAVSMSDCFYESFTTTAWCEGSWSEARGWPSTVSFIQDRLCWAATESEPTGEWMSKTGNYVDYGVSDPLVDSDAISVNLPSRKFSGINNLLPMTRLISLTASGEFATGAGSSGVLSPTSISVTQQGERGCSTVTPVVIGNQAIYMQPRGTIVRNIAYDYASDSFTGNNLSIMSEHLFRKYSITDMTYCAEPDSIAYFVRSDGTLLTLTYLPEQQVIAWTHFDTSGTFESCASIPTDGYDELWVVVNRTNGRFIERMADLLPTTDTEDQFHVDCGITYDDTETTAISGLDHLEGLSVIALADGCVQGPFTVVDGAITLTTAASLVHIGLAYTVDMETLAVELNGQDGTSQGRKKRVAKLTTRFTDSLGGYWGPDEDHLHPIVPAPPATLGTARELFTGDKQAPISPSWENAGQIFLRQTDPLPFNVTGVFPVVEVGNL